MTHKIFDNKGILGLFKSENEAREAINKIQNELSETQTKIYGILRISKI